MLGMELSFTSLHKIFGVLLIVILSTACTTQRTLSLIENHAGNMEVKAITESQTLLWASSPDFEGQQKLPKLGGCEQTNYSVFGGFTGKALRSVEGQYRGVSRKPDEEKMSSYLESVGDCDLVFVENRECWGTCKLDSPVMIEAIDKQGTVKHSFSPEPREDIPAWDWPAVIGSAILDIPLALLSLPWLLWESMELVK